LRFAFRTTAGFRGLGGDTRFLLSQASLLLRFRNPTCFLGLREPARLFSLCGAACLLLSLRETAGFLLSLCHPARFLLGSKACALVGGLAFALGRRGATSPLLRLRGTALLLLGSLPAELNLPGPASVPLCPPP